MNESGGVHGRTVADIPLGLKTRVSNHQGVRYVPAGDSSEQTDWSVVRELWSQSGSK